MNPCVPQNVPEYPSIAVAADISRPTNRLFIKGVGDYIRDYPGWEVRVAEPPLETIPDHLFTRVDGIMAEFHDPRIVEMVSRLEKKLVAYGGGCGWYDPTSGIPYFSTDNVRIGQIAADHLLAAGYLEFGFCGYEETRLTDWSLQRAKVFADRLKEKGHGCQMFAGPTKRTHVWTMNTGGLHDWLTNLPKPVGVMACTDGCALRLLDACHHLGIRVPDEVGIVSVDNDDTLCELAQPTLSSIEQGFRRMGYEAAELLDRMLNGEVFPDFHRVIPPVGLIVRASSDITLTEDPLLTELLRYIRQHVEGGVTVSDVLKQAGMSRTALDKRFKKHLGRTIQAQIEQARLSRIKVLLEQSGCSIKEICYRTGFTQPSYLSAFFKKQTGQNPSDYRKNAQHSRRLWQVKGSVP